MYRNLHETRIQYGNENNETWKLLTVKSDNTFNNDIKITKI